MHAGWIDLRSDTVTTPTPEMRLAMQNAEVGDDFFEDDPTVQKLEALAAARLGKEAALFVPSGTMGNQLAIMTHTRPGNEILVGRDCHIVSHELGAAGLLSGVNYAVAPNENGYVTAEDVARLARPKQDDYAPDTGLLCLENALGNGRVVPLATMQAAADAAKERGIPVHLDGARIFNAALVLGVDVAEVAAPADSVMFCVSKGLGAPVGSLLCGSAAFVHKARINRKLIGGGMRQAGVLAACGIVALEDMTQRLVQDHANARLMATLLDEIPGVQVNWDRQDINMVFWQSTDERINGNDMVEFLRARNIKSLGPDGGEYRFMAHKDTSEDDIRAVAKALREYVDTLV